MNERLYDPILRRFLNADENIQDPENMQSYNKYGYVMNNPLMFNDPSGESFWSDLVDAATRVVNFVVDTVVAVATAVVGAVLTATAVTIGAITGVCQFIGSGFQDSSILRNQFDILGGLFQGSASQILSRFTKELPQTLLGLGVSLGANAIGRVKSVSYYDGATLVEDYCPRWGGFTLGSYIYASAGTKADPNDYLFQHEYGHYLQSQDVGWGYMRNYAIPSLIDTMTLKNPDDKHQHTAFCTEQDANTRARDYFGHDVWQYDKNPIFFSGYNDWFDLNYVKFRIKL